MEAKIENIQSQMRKGVLEYCIMLIVMQKPAYVNDLIDSMKEAKLIVVEGTLYPLLTRLKNAGYLNYNWIESVQGPPRKYYEITDAGRELLAGMDDVYGQIQHSVNFIRNNIK